VSARTAFRRWLAGQVHRDDEVGEYARACTLVRIDDGAFDVPDGMREHAEVAALEFSKVLDVKRTTPIYEVARLHHIGPLALAELLRRGLPHRRFDDEYFADRDEVGVWLGEQHEPGMCGQWLAILEGDAPRV
jgi:hypothetical protein